MGKFWPYLLSGLLSLGSAQAKPGLPDGFVYLDEFAPGIGQDIRYAGADNFIGRRLKGYDAPRCILTKAAARALGRAAHAIRSQGLALRVFDCYRPESAVRDMAAWSRDGRPARSRAYYFPGYSKRDLFRAGYIARRSGHSRGSTVDLTLVRQNMAAKARPQAGLAGAGPPAGADKALRCDAPRPEGRHTQADALDMGTDFDCFSRLSATASRKVSPRAQKNRRTLLRVMQAAGFKNYSAEWWHFRLAREPYRKRYFNFPVR